MLISSIFEFFKIDCDVKVNKSQNTRPETLNIDNTPTMRFRENREEIKKFLLSKFAKPLNDN